MPAGKDRSALIQARDNRNTILNPVIVPTPVIPTTPITSGGGSRGTIAVSVISSTTRPTPTPSINHPAVSNPPSTSQPAVSAGSGGSGGGGGSSSTVSYSGGSSGGGSSIPFTSGGGGSYTPSSPVTPVTPVVSSPTPITSTQPSTPQPVFISVQELEDKIAATEEKVEQMLTKTDESEQEIEQQVENIEQIEQAIVQQQIEAESNTNTNTNTATIEALEKKLVQVQNLSSQLQIKQIEQQKELSVAKAKCEALIKQLASKKKLTNFTYDQQELHRLTTPQAVAQFAREQVQAIKDQAQSQKVGLKKTANPTLPKKALTTPQKVAIGGGVVAGALVIIGVVAKVISAKNNKK